MRDAYGVAEFECWLARVEVSNGLSQIDKESAPNDMMITYFLGFGFEFGFMNVRCFLGSGGELVLNACTKRQN